jgi:predicted TIM-barrel fold metal-dependent hydrolase
MDAALYIHPTAPFNAPHYETRGFFGALAGFPHDVWLHTMGLIFSGAFDRFPKLRLVIGHMGECLPLQLYRFDWMQGNADGRAHLRGGKQVKLQHPVSHYFRNNIWITTSGVAWEPAIKFCMEVLGPDRVLYAMDYPYQQSSDEVAAYDRMHLGAEHKKMLMEDNARRVFNLPH